jgi:sugar O-acyltransferase (sialic acid O-acetyltransferase NeuD family)
MKKIDVTLIGFGTVGKTVSSTFNEVNIENIVITPGFEHNLENQFKKKLISWADFLAMPSRIFFVCIGYQNLNKVRESIFTQALDSKHIPLTLVHKTAYVSKTAVIGPGSLIMPNSTVENHSTIGKGSFIWSGSVIGHDSSVGNFAFLSANVSVGGSASIGHFSLVGLGSIIGNKVSVGESSIIGAGSKLGKHVPPGSVVLQSDTVVSEWPSQEFLKLTNFDNIQDPETNSPM